MSGIGLSWCLGWMASHAIRRPSSNFGLTTARQRPGVTNSGRESFAGVNIPMTSSGRPAKTPSQTQVTGESLRKRKTMTSSRQARKHHSKRVTRVNKKMGKHASLLGNYQNAPKTMKDRPSHIPNSISVSVSHPAVSIFPGISGRSSPIVCMTSCDGLSRSLP